MKKQTKGFVSFVFLLIGFMVAIQFQTTTTEHESRDTRDQWEVRESLKAQQEAQQELLSKISIADQTISDYEDKSSGEKIQTLKKSIQKLEQKVGLQELEGDGVIITIDPIFQESGNGQAYPTVSPQSLTRLLNELNRFGAKAIAVGNERLTNLSPVRDVNGSTYMNNRPLPPLPIKIKVLGSDPVKLLDSIQASQSKDLFSIENLDLQADLKKNMTLPGYDEPLHLEILEEIGG